MFTWIIAGIWLIDAPPIAEACITTTVYHPAGRCAARVPAGEGLNILGIIDDSLVAIAMYSDVTSSPSRRTVSSTVPIAACAPTPVGEPTSKQHPHNSTITSPVILEKTRGKQASPIPCRPSAF